MSLHYRRFLKTLPSKLPYCITHKFLITHFFVGYFLFQKFIQTFYLDRPIHTKDDLFILDNGVFDGLFKIICRHQISMGIFNSFVFCNKFENLLIYFLITLNYATKSFFFCTDIFIVYFYIHQIIVFVDMSNS